MLRTGKVRGFGVELNKQIEASHTALLAKPPSCMWSKDRGQG